MGNNGGDIGRVGTHQRHSNNVRSGPDPQATRQRVGSRRVKPARPALPDAQVCTAEAETELRQLPLIDVSKVVPAESYPHSVDVEASSTDSLARDTRGLRTTTPGGKHPSRVNFWLSPDALISTRSQDAACWPKVGWAVPSWEVSMCIRSPNRTMVGQPLDRIQAPPSRHCARSPVDAVVGSCPRAATTVPHVLEDGTSCA